MTRPNLLFVVSDQFRAMCLQDDPVRTPHLDALMAEGIVVTQAVSSYPVCSPHRAMMMTGQHPTRNGVDRNVNSGRPGVQLRDGAPTWASALREAGYRTGLIGKWHLESPRLPEDERHGEGRRADGLVWDAWSPPERRFGFDDWYSYGCEDAHLAPHYWPTAAPREGRISVDDWSAHHETDVAIDYLRGRDRSRPFALMVSWNPPHQPFDELPSWAPLSHYEGAELLTRPNVDRDSEAGREAARIAPEYFAAVEAVDAELGRLLDAVASLGLASDTIVVFTSDHGMQLGSHGEIYKNVPFEESMRLPLVLRVPGVAPAEVAAMLGSVDVAPTLLGLCGVPVPAAMQGRDLAAVLRGEEPADDAETALYYRWPTHEGDASARGLRTHGFKYTVTRDADGAVTTRLVDLRDDPFELRPRTDPALEADLAGRLLRALAAAGETWEGDAWLAERSRPAPTTPTAAP